MKAGDGVGGGRAQQGFGGHQVGVGKGGRRSSPWREKTEQFPGRDKRNKLKSSCRWARRWKAPPLAISSSYVPLWAIAAVVEHEDVVGVADGAEAMGDDDAGGVDRGQARRPDAWVRLSSALVASSKRRSAAA